MGTPRKRRRTRAGRRKTAKKHRRQASPAAAPRSEFEQAQELAEFRKQIAQAVEVSKLEIAALKLQATAAREKGKRGLAEASTGIRAEAKRLARQGKPRTRAIVSRILLHKSWVF